MALRIAVELHEHKIPDLDITAAIARKCAIRMADFAGGGTKIVMNFRARPARSSLAHLPEIVLLIQTYDAIASDAGTACPEIDGCIILSEYRHPELIDGQFEFFRQQRPRVIDCLFLEISAEREIAEHFEERLMTPRVADVVQIIVLAAGAYTLLAGCRCGV